MWLFLLGINLWEEDIPERTLVVLSGKDLLCDTKVVAEWLDTDTRAKVGRGGGGGRPGWVAGRGGGAGRGGVGGGLHCLAHYDKAPGTQHIAYHTISTFHDRP